MEQLKLALESRAFEMAYERTAQQVETVCDAERLRQARVRVLLLEGDNEDLRVQLSRDDDCLVRLETRNKQVKKDLEVCSRRLENAQGDLRVRSREVETLKAEVNSLHGVTMDSTKLLTEKLTLARELTALKPEVEHLRSQAVSHQSLLSDKLSLQRQLSTVQVELETEKRATQRALAKEAKIQVEDAKHEPRLETLQADLAKERRERQRTDREAQKASSESDNRISTLESRLDAFRNKLKSTKEQLKEAQTSLQTLQACNHDKFSRASTPAKSTMSLVGNPHKRAAAQVDADTIIGTPGDLPAAKKSKHGSTLIGAKSNFSTTPFLNRAVGAAREIPRLENASGDDEQHIRGSERVSEYPSQEKISEPVLLSKGTKTAVQAQKPGILGNAKTCSIEPRAAPARKAKAAPILSKVAEQDVDNGGSSSSVGDLTATKDLSNETFQMKRRKRKLLGGGLGKTVFDEDEGVALEGDRGLYDGPGGFGKLGKRGFETLKFRPSKAIGSDLSIFGTISPLKKDRKAT